MKATCEELTVVGSPCMTWGTEDLPTPEYDVYVPIELNLQTPYAVPPCIAVV